MTLRHFETKFGQISSACYINNMEAFCTLADLRSQIKAFWMYYGMPVSECAFTEISCLEKGKGIFFSHFYRYFPYAPKLLGTQLICRSHLLTKWRLQVNQWEKERVDNFSSLHLFILCQDAFLRADMTFPLPRPERIILTGTRKPT